MTDLLSLVLTLRPTQPAPAPPPLGRAAHALALEALRRADHALAQSVHDASGPKPFTASGLVGPWHDGLLPAETYTLRFTALTAPIAGAFRRALEPGGLWANGAILTLAECTLQVESASVDGHPWAGATTYEALSAPWLLGRRVPEPRLTLRFASPTVFKSGGRHVPVPLPQWVWGSLIEKWNAFAPVALPAETRRFAEECLALTAYNLRTRMTPFKDGGLRPGAVGVARYTALNRDRYWLSVMHLLAEFAFFAGVGVGVTMGLGQCRQESGSPGDEPPERGPRAALDAL